MLVGGMVGGLSTDTLRGVQFIAAPTYTFDYSAQPVRSRAQPRSPLKSCPEMILLFARR